MSKNIEPYLHTRNWFNYSKFYDFIASKPEILKVVEIGTFKGFSISRLVKQMLKAGKKNIEVYAVDLWEKVEWPGADEGFVQNELPYLHQIYDINLKRAGVREYIKDIQDFSDLAAKRFKDEYFDFVFIDADHREEPFRKDLYAWKSKVRKGGILAGHDYSGHPVEKVVREAVEGGFISPVELDRQGNVWYTTV